MSSAGGRVTSSHGRFGNANKSGRKYNYWSNKFRQAQSRGAIETLPVLGVHSRSQSSSPEVLFTSWLEALEVYVRREYGEIADIFTLGEYPEFEDVEVDEEDLTIENDPYGFEKKKIETRI